MLEVVGVNQYYGGSHVLRNVSLTVREGACTALLGRNGAGKTTLLRCIVGLLPTASGRIRLGGQDVTELPSYRRTRLGIGLAPQGREIFADLSVGENLAIAMVANRVEDPAAAKEEVLGLFPVLRDMWRRRGGDLSGGQQQQLAIARALVTRPSLLILDEPTEGIQPSIVKTIEAVIRSLKGRMSILLVEQYYEFARRLADDYVVLSRGSVVASGRGETMDQDDVKRHLAI